MSVNLADKPFHYMTLSIDPGPKESGYVVTDKGAIVEFGKAPLKEIKLLQSRFKIDRLLIEVTDWPIALAGESYRDTNIVIGRILEFFKCIKIQIGRKEARDHFNLKNDAAVIKFFKAKGIKLRVDAWQAYLIYYYYENQ